MRKGEEKKRRKRGTDGGGGSGRQNGKSLLKRKNPPIKIKTPRKGKRTLRSGEKVTSKAEGRWGGVGWGLRRVGGLGGGVGGSIENRRTEHIKINPRGQLRYAKKTGRG